MGSKKKHQQGKISDDELLDQCIRDNKLCFHTGCSKMITVISLRCHLCSNDFCPTHILPEIHGCGAAARKDAAAPAKPKVNPEKSAQLENKLSKKLQQMKNDRKKKPK